MKTLLHIVSSFKGTRTKSNQPPNLPPAPTQKSSFSACLLFSGSGSFTVVRARGCSFFWSLTQLGLGLLFPFVKPEINKYTQNEARRQMLRLCMGALRGIFAVSLEMPCEDSSKFLQINKM